jgi:hypothetical protein
METRQNTEPAPLTWLLRRQESGTTTIEALDFFDSLPPVALNELIGRWRGSGLRSGHPLDGLLEAFGWYGKEFVDPDAVHPLLFVDSAGAIVAVDSRHIPFSMMTKVELKGTWLTRTLFSVLRPLVRTTEPRARIRMMEHRGQVSATMIYDFLPIHDVFRQVDQDTLLGLMDLRGVPQPFFFVLRRASDRDTRADQVPR